MKKLWFNVIEKDGSVSKIGVEPKHCVMVGFAGRSIEKTMEHVRELEAAGVPAPKSVPAIYSCTTAMLTQDDKIQVNGNNSSGELEFLLLKHQGTLFIGICSDHTDRSMEGYSVVKSKAVCEKPIGKDVWRYEDVKDHWDGLRMKSWQVAPDGNTEDPYQDGQANEILEVEKLMEAVSKEYANTEDSCVFSGTVKLLHGFVYGKKFRGEILDTVLNRRLTLSYEVETLPVD